MKSCWKYFCMEKLGCTWKTTASLIGTGIRGIERRAEAIKESGRMNVWTIVVMLYDLQAVIRLTQELVKQGKIYY